MILIIKSMVLNNGDPYAYVVPIDESGNVNDKAFLTLINFIELVAQGDKLESDLRDLVAKAERGVYSSPNKESPDFGVNDVNLWLDEPMSPKGYVTITNENTDCHSEAENLQRFTFAQFWAALNFMREVREFEKEYGVEALLREGLACVLPAIN